MNRKILIAQAFGSKVASYNQHALLQTKIARKLASFLPDLRQANILELGCGTGLVTQYLISKYPDSTLYISDLSEDMLSFTRNHSKHHSTVHFLQLDGETLPDSFYQKFDLIISSMALQWFDQPEIALKKMQYCLKPDSFLLYSTLAPNSFPEWRHSLEELSLPSGLLLIPPLPGRIDQDVLTVPYKTTIEFFQILKSQGTATPNKSYIPLTPSLFRKALKYADMHYRGVVSWHINYGKLSSIPDNSGNQTFYTSPIPQS